MDGEFCPVIALLLHALQLRASQPLLYFRQQWYSASQLHDKVVRIAEVLLAGGIKPGDTVGVCMQRGPELLAALLALWSCGAVYVPLDPLSPRERLRQQGLAARLQLLLSQPGLQAEMEQLPFPLLQVLPLTDTGDSAGLCIPSQGELTESSPAYLMFTSGSSGQPKAVVLSHGNVSSFFAAVRQLWALPCGLRYLAVSNPCFDISLFELLAPLLFDGTLLLASQTEHADPQLLLQLMAQQQADVVQATPSLWQLLCSQPWPSAAPLALAISIGEPLGKTLAGHLLPHCHQLWNLYGPTECTVWATAHQVKAADIEAQAPAVVAIGRTLPGYHGSLDEHGELWLSGGAVALGYLASPALTAERFPIDPATQQRCYRTGDLCRRDAEGCLHFLGRRDNQVKLNGHRIELEEIENRLQQHYSIAAAACVVRQLQHQANGGQLLAFIVCRAGTPNKNAQRFNSWLAETLPDWMLPHRYLVVNALPLTANGKLDRQALLQLAVQPEAGDCQPLGALGRQVAAIFCEILEIPGIGTHDSFFDLGGSSMLSAALVLAINQHFGTRLSLRQVLATPPTVQSLTLLLQTSSARSASN